MKPLLLILLFLAGCATQKEVQKLRYDLNMLHGYNARLLQADQRARDYSHPPKPLPYDLLGVASMPQIPQVIEVPKIVYVFTNANDRMQVDPEWLATYKGTPVYSDKKSVERMKAKNEALQRLLKEARTIEENQ
jgi:hypothetical protein